MGSNPGKCIGTLPFTVTSRMTPCLTQPSAQREQGTVFLGVETLKYVSEHSPPFNVNDVAEKAWSFTSKPLYTLPSY
jgi:hypothetical protein